MPSRAPDALRPPEALLDLRRRVRTAERRGVDVAGSKRLLVRALLAHRARRLEEMGTCLQEAARLLGEEEGACHEERLRRGLWALRERGVAADRLAGVEAALAQKDLPKAEAALAQAAGRGASAGMGSLSAACVAALAFESRNFVILVARATPQGWRLLQVRRGEAAPEELDAAISRALAALRPRPRFVHVALPQDSHVLAPVALPAIPDSERDQAVRWKLAKLCDFDVEDALLASRPLRGQGGNTLGLVAPARAVGRIRAMVGRAGLPVGRILPPAEALALMLTQAGGGQGLLDVGRDGAWFYVFGPAGLAFSRDLGVGTSLWLRALETPVNSTRGTLRLTSGQASEVLERFDISGSENLVLGDGTSLNDKDIHSLLRPSLERLQDALARSIDFAAGQGGGIPVGSVWLCGEGASLPGLDRVLAAHTGVRVERLDPAPRFSLQEGASLAPADCLAASLLLAQHAAVLDLAPLQARVEARLYRAAPAAFAAGFLLAAALAGLGISARLQRLPLEGQVLQKRTRLADLDGKAEAFEAAFAARQAAPPPSPSLPADLLRELARALPPGCMLRRLSLARREAGGSLLELDMAEGPDLVQALSGHPRFARMERLPDAAGGRRYRCVLLEGKGA